MTNKFIKIAAATVLLSGSSAAVLSAQVKTTRDSVHPDSFPPVAAPKTQVEGTQLQVEKPATFPGGNQNINPYIAKNIVYPPEAIEQGIEGKVTVTFTINKEGNITDVKVRQPVHPLLDAAAINIIKKMPRWEPAMFKAEPVSTLYTIPINFKLQ